MLEIQNIVTASDCHIIQALQKHLLHWSFALKQSTSHEANEAIIHLTNATHTHTHTCTHTCTRTTVLVAFLPVYTSSLVFRWVVHGRHGGVLLLGDRKLWSVLKECPDREQVEGNQGDCRLPQICLEKCLLEWFDTEECGGHPAMGESGASEPTCHLDTVQGGGGARATTAARLNRLPLRCR